MRTQQQGIRGFFRYPFINLLLLPLTANAVGGFFMSGLLSTRLTYAAIPFTRGLYTLALSVGFSVMTFSVVALFGLA